MVIQLAKILVFEVSVYYRDAWLLVDLTERFTLLYLADQSCSARNNSFPVAWKEKQKAIVLIESRPRETENKWIG